MERWSSGVMESQPRRMRRRRVGPLGVAHPGSWHPDLRHNTAQKERTILRVPMRRYEVVQNLRVRTIFQLSVSRWLLAAGRASSVIHMQANR